MVALIFCGDLRYCPYVTRYIERLKIYKIDYRIYFWNRSQIDVTNIDNCCYFDEAANLSLGKIGKVNHFFRFRKWLISKIESDKPSKLVILSTLTGVLLGNVLYKKYSGKYIFDIRDYSYENILPYYLIEKRIIKKSRFTAISSEGYLAFLPKGQYVIAHNFNRKDINENSHFERKNIPLQFVWNGVVRYFDFQKQYLNALKNDDRFVIVFYGDGPDLEKYKEYCAKEEFTNVQFFGAYDNSCKAELLNNAAILNNCYGYVHNAGNKIRYAVSNRFYDGMVFHIPQIVEQGGHKSEWIDSCKIGCSIAPDEHFADKLYLYYQTIEEDVFDENCAKELAIVLKQDDEYIHKIDECILY